MNHLGTRAGEIESWIRSNLFDEVPMAISVISRDFRVQEANRRFTEAFGPWEGRPCYEVYKKRTEPCLRDPEPRGGGRSGRAADRLPGAHGADDPAQR